MPLLSNWLTHARLSRVSPHLRGVVLDIGCGHGELLDFLPPQVERVILVDRSPARRQKIDLRRLAARVPAEFVLLDVDQSTVDLRFDKVDTLVMAAILEHLKHPVAVLRQLKKTLKPNGRLIVTTPSPLGGKLHWVGSHLRLTYPEAAEEHEQFYGPEALDSLFDRCGYEIEHRESFIMGLNQLVVARPAQKEEVRNA